MTGLDRKSFYFKARGWIFHNHAYIYLKPQTAVTGEENVTEAEGLGLQHSRHCYPLLQLKVLSRFTLSSQVKVVTPPRRDLDGPGPSRGPEGVSASSPNHHPVGEHRAGRAPLFPQSTQRKEGRREGGREGEKEGVG